MLKHYLILASALLLIGLWAWWGGDLEGALYSPGWPAAQGTIIASAAAYHAAPAGGYWSAQIAYTYQVVGTPYTGTRLAFGSSDGDEARVRGFLQPYPVGAAVAVYYNPDDPSSAVLEPGFAQAGLRWVDAVPGRAAAAVGVLLIGFAVLVRFGRRGRRPARPAADLDPLPMPEEPASLPATDSPPRG